MDDVLQWKRALLSLCDGNPLAAGFPYKIPVIRHCDNYFLFILGQSVEKTIELPVIWHAKTTYALIAGHGNSSQLATIGDVDSYFDVHIQVRTKWLTICKRHFQLHMDQGNFYFLIIKKQTNNKTNKTRPTLERRVTLGHLRSIKPNMINHFAS